MVTFRLLENLRTNRKYSKGRFLNVLFILTHKPVNTAITPTPLGFVTHPASLPPGSLWQAHACIPTWGRRGSLLPSNRDSSLLLHKSSSTSTAWNQCYLTWQWEGGTWGCSQFWSQAWPSQTSLPCRTPGWTPHIYNTAKQSLLLKYLFNREQLLQTDGNFTSQNTEEFLVYPPRLFCDFGVTLKNTESYPLLQPKTTCKSRMFGFIESMEVIQHIHYELFYPVRAFMCWWAALMSFL